MRRPIPLPPSARPERLPDLVPSQQPALWRLHWDEDPRVPHRHSRGRFRFDAPAGEFAVTYLNESRHGCFGEVYGDRQAIPPKDRARILSRITPTERLRLVPLDDGELLKALHPELDGRISSDIQYRITREWSVSLYGWYPDAHGLRYVARHATPHLNYCLFLERCQDLLDLDSQGMLEDLPDLVTRACYAYALAPRLFESRDKGGW